MTLHAINQAALVKSTDNSGNSCNMRASFLKLIDINIMRVFRLQNNTESNRIFLLAFCGHVLEQLAFSPIL
jgi:hypothetical protein